MCDQVSCYRDDIHQGIEWRAVRRRANRNVSDLARTRRKVETQTQKERKRERENREREREKREREEIDRERDRLGEEIGIEVYREGIWKDRIE